MKLFRIILIILFALVIIIFTIQNAEVVEVKFLNWSVETSRALLMLVCAAIGSLCTILALLPMFFGGIKKKNTGHSDSLDHREEAAN